MRNMKSLAALLAAIYAVLAATAGAAFAADTPTTAVGLAQAVDLSDAKSAGLIIVGLMVAAGVVLWGARLVMSKFQPKI
jgi:hypothetical protein